MKASVLTPGTWLFVEDDTHQYIGILIEEYGQIEFVGISNEGMPKVICERNMGNYQIRVITELKTK